MTRNATRSALVFSMAFLTALVAVSLLSAPVQAQARAVEFGMDLGVTVTNFEDSDITLIEVGIPAQRLRVGAFISDQVSIETSVAFSLVDVDDFTTTTTDLALGVNIHSTPNHMDLRVYAAPFGGVSIVSLDDETDTQWSAGAALGLKAPVREIFLVRIEASYARGFENSNVAGSNNFQGVVGLSFLVL